MNVKPFFIKTITPLHMGSGNDLGVVDMPIQRESHTQFPKIEASSLKGSLRKEYEGKNKEDLFGKSDKRGELSFSDARILFFPIKSVKGLFAYVTCPFVLNRFKDDISLYDNSIPNIQSLDDNTCMVLKDNINKIDDNNIILEEYPFSIKEEDFEIPNIDIKKERIVIVSDDNFKEFVKNSTEINTRIRINEETGVVAGGALFTEEYLPAETYMYALALKESNEFEENIFNPVQQMGGNSTLGKGIVKILGIKNG